MFDGQTCRILHTRYANHLGWAQNSNWREKPNVWHLIVVSNTGSPLCATWTAWTKSTSTRGNAHRVWAGFQAVPHYEHTLIRPYPFCQVHLLLLLWVIHMPHKSNCANPRWRAPTCRLPTPREIGKRIESVQSGLAGCILLVRVGKTETLPALLAQFNHLLLPRCTAGPACDWLGQQPDSMQFVA